MTGILPTEATNIKSTAPTLEANSVAAQLQYQLGKKATVTATGSQVTVMPKYGLSEQQMSNLKVTVQATSVPPTLTGISFSVKDVQGNTVDLEDSALVASGIYIYNFKQPALNAYNEALIRQDAYYILNFPSPSVIDAITIHFKGEHTFNKQKIVTVFTIDCDPTKDYNGDK